MTSLNMLKIKSHKMEMLFMAAQFIDWFTVDTLDIITALSITSKTWSHWILAVLLLAT